MLNFSIMETGYWLFKAVTPSHETQSQVSSTIWTIGSDLGQGHVTKLHYLSAGTRLGGGNAGRAELVEFNSNGSCFGIPANDVPTHCELQNTDILQHERPVHR